MILRRFGYGPRRTVAIALLDIDPDLGQLLPDDRREAARAELRAQLTTFPVGEWQTDRLKDADPTHLGLLIDDGVLAREVLLEDTVSTELLGPGDVVRPWLLVGPPQLLPATIRWNALTPVRAALLDRRVALALGRYPEVNAVIVDRTCERAQRLAITQAISQLNRVDRRLLALFWHLAERWGRVSPDGIVVPLALSHRLLGQLVGARRPTVSTALADLARDGQLARRDDGTWLLTAEPAEVPVADAVELVRQRRRLLPAPKPAPEQAAAAVDGRLATLRESLYEARATSARHREVQEVLRAETATLKERTLDLRRERDRRLETLRRAAQTS